MRARTSEILERRLVRGGDDQGAGTHVHGVGRPVRLARSGGDRGYEHLLQIPARADRVRPETVRHTPRHPRHSGVHRRQVDGDARVLDGAWGRTTCLST